MADRKSGSKDGKKVTRRSKGVEEVYASNLPTYNASTATAPASWRGGQRTCFCASDSDSTGSLHQRPASRDWDEQPVGGGAKEDWDDEEPVGGRDLDEQPVGSSSARDSDEEDATPVASDDERPFATDDAPADAKDWDDQPVGGPTLGDLDKQQTPEAKRNEGMKKAAAMMRQMGGKGEGCHARC